jgi:pyridoxal phosphate enzyme (YggS family)
VSRAQEVAAALAALGNRLANAARQAGRAPDEIAILPVTKFFPASDVVILHDLGCHDFGESREPEASRKIAELSGLPDVRWHMIGRLQRNKIRTVVRWADTVESVDSARLVDDLDAAVVRALDAGLRADALRVLLQVSLDDDPARGGAARAEVPALADRVACARGLRLGGVMAVAPRGADPRRAFAELARVHGDLLRDHPDATERSAGMSGDLEIAVEYGSTCVRVGTALLGSRPIISP